MYAVTLIAAPGALDPELVHALRNAWGGGDAQWLSPDEAAEFTVTEKPQNQWDIWQDLQARGTDLVVQPSEGRQKRVLLADMDSTMIHQECIDELAETAGVGERVREITVRAMNGELDFEGAVLERVALLRGQDESIIQSVLDQQITLVTGGTVLLATMKANGAYAALVSGGFTAFTRHVAATLGFDESRANELLVDQGKLTGDIARPILGRDAKVSAMEEITGRLGLAAADVLAVGDGANDLGMLGAAGMGVALHAKPAVAAQCDLRINHGDLTALLFLQGYARDQFVTP